LLAQDDLRAPSSEARVVLRLPERPVETGRRDLQGIGGRYHVFDVQDRAQLAAHRRAIVDADAVLSGGRRAGPIDLHAKHHPAGFAAELHVEDLQPKVGRHATSHGPNPSDEVIHFFGALNEKSGHTPTRSYTQAPNPKL